MVHIWAFSCTGSCLWTDFGAQKSVFLHRKFLPVGNGAYLGLFLHRKLLWAEDGAKKGLTLVVSPFSLLCNLQLLAFVQW